MAEENSPPPHEGKNFRAVVGLIVILGGLAGLAGLYFIDIPTGNRDLLSLALGLVLGWGGAVVTFEYGSSATSRGLSQQLAEKNSDFR